MIRYNDIDEIDIKQKNDNKKKKRKKKNVEDEQSKNFKSNISSDPTHSPSNSTSPDSSPSNLIDGADSKRSANLIFVPKLQKFKSVLIPRLSRFDKDDQRQNSSFKSGGEVERTSDTDDQLSVALQSPQTKPNSKNNVPSSSKLLSEPEILPLHQSNLEAHTNSLIQQSHRTDPSDQPDLLGTFVEGDSHSKERPREIDDRSQNFNRPEDHIQSQRSDSTLEYVQLQASLSSPPHEPSQNLSPLKHDPTPFKSFSRTGPLNPNGPNLFSDLSDGSDRSLAETVTQPHNVPTRGEASDREPDPILLDQDGLPISSQRVSASILQPDHDLDPFGFSKAEESVKRLWMEEKDSGGGLNKIGSTENLAEVKAASASRSKVLSDDPVIGSDLSLRDLLPIPKRLRNHTEPTLKKARKRGNGRGESSTRKKRQNRSRFGDDENKDEGRGSKKRSGTKTRGISDEGPSLTEKKNQEKMKLNRKKKGLEKHDGNDDSEINDSQDEDFGREKVTIDSKRGKREGKDQSLNDENEEGTRRRKRSRKPLGEKKVVINIVNDRKFLESQSSSKSKKVGTKDDENKSDGNKKDVKEKVGESYGGFEKKNDKNGTREESFEEDEEDQVLSLGKDRKGDEDEEIKKKNNSNSNESFEGRQNRLKFFKSLKKFEFEEEIVI